MKHMTRRALALLLTLSMVCGLLCTTTFAAGGTWSGSGTQADPYLIEDADDLTALATAVNGCDSQTGTWFKVTNDITVSDWTPIGTNKSYPFKGYFDGDNHTITINNIAASAQSGTYVGLFGYLMGYFVANVIVDGNITASQSSYCYVGGIAGYLDAGTSSSEYNRTIVNCVNKAAISVSGSTYNYAGGIVGFINAKKNQVNNCYNTGSVTSAGYAGGIFGYANNGTIQYCYSNAAVTGRDGYSGEVYGKSFAQAVTECYSASTWSQVSDQSAWVTAANALETATYVTLTSTDFWSLGANGPEHVLCDHQHAEGDAGTVTDPTCTEKGYTTYTCTICGKDYKADYVDALGHDLETVTTAATCTEAGSTTQTCKRENCGYTATFELPALGHDYVNGYCSRCGGKEPAIRTVGTGTSSDKIAPYHNYYKNSLVEMIYTADEIGFTGTLESVAFQVAATSSFSTTAVKIYMGHTDKSSFSSTSDWMAASDLTLVYEGSPTLGTETGWETVALDTTFDYNGTDNLVVAVSKTSDSYNSSLKYYYTTTSDKTVLYRGNDGNAAYADCDNTTLAGYQGTNRPNIQLAFRDESDEPPTVTHSVTFTGENATITVDGEPVASASVEDGGSLSFTVMAANGYAVEKVMADTTELTAAEGVYTLNNITADIIVTITAAEVSVEEDDGVYQIGTEAELRAFAEKVANGEYNAKAKLTADIVLTADWTPIGSRTTPYTGTFDGDGHTISGLHINGSDPYAGLFGYVYNVTIQNVVVKGYVRSTAATGSAGAVAAHAKGENTFTNVGAEAIVISANTNTGYNGAGGILGFVETNSAAVFSSCYNKGAVSTRSGYAGGIVGGSNCYYANTEAGINASITLTDCYNLGSVTKTGYGGYVGGIIGYSYDAVLTNCYGLGDVTEGFGQLAGNVTDGTVGTNCYPSASDDLTAANLGDSYQNGDTINGEGKPALTWETAAYAAPVCLTGIAVTTPPTNTEYTTTEEFNPAGMVVTASYSDGTSKSVTDYTWSPSDTLTVDVTGITVSYNDYRTVVDDVMTTVNITVQQVKHTVAFNCDTGVYIYVGSGGTGYEVTEGANGHSDSVIVYDTYPLSLGARAEDGYEVDSVTASGAVLTDLGDNSYKIASVTSDATITVTAKVSDSYFPGTGTGTETDPYLIQNETDLRTLAEKVNGGTNYYGVYFKMTNDIALTSDWTPIGKGAYYTETYAFKGTFDGGGHTVSGLRIEMNNAADNNGYGLFGLVSGATIKNLAVSGEITNVNDSTAAGDKSYFGGIVGVANGNVTLENCAGHVDVTNQFYWQSSGTAPESYVGGLIGYSYNYGTNLTIQNCYSDGTVTNKNISEYYYSTTKTYVGGLVGGFYHYSENGGSAITNSFAYGTVNYSYKNWAGPIIGLNNESTNQKVSAATSYYLTGIAGEATDDTGATAKSTTEFLTLASALNSAAGSNLFQAGTKGHPIFTWETETQEEQPAVTADTSWYSEEEDSFTITTEAQLLGFAALVNGGTDFAGKTVSLANDIALTAEWTPAGSQDHPFSGTFQGGGHTISGLNVSKKTTQDYNGLFGYINEAVIEKLIVSGSVTGGNYTAGIAGRAYNATIQYCGNEAAITGHGYAGGIVGYASGTTITECYNKSSVGNTKTTDVYTGGIAGDLVSNSSIVSSYNTGSINGTSATDNYCYTGGIAGMAQTCAIVNSYSAGTVNGKTYTGGILGSGNLYYQQSGFNYYLEGTASAGAGTGDDSAEYIASVSADDLKNGESDAVANLGSAYAAPVEGTNNGYPTLKWESDPDYVRSYITEIYTRADMYEFANNVKSGYSYEGETVKLMNDVDLEGSYDSVTKESAGAWTAIGDANGTVFAGTFDGQNHTVSNMVLLNDYSGSLGLFSALPKSAVVKNLTVTGQAWSNGDSTESSCIGGIVGWNQGTVENCVSDVAINVYYYYMVGGIAGDNAGTVRNCVNYGNVNGHTSSSRVGGVIGRVEPAYDNDTSGCAVTTPVVEGIVNYGDVTGYQYVGGLVGGMFNEDSDLDDCGVNGGFNAGTVTCNYSYSSDGAYCGLLVGNARGDIVNCYYVLDTETVPVTVGDAGGENYARPVTENYASTAEFAAKLGTAFTVTDGKLTVVRQTVTG